MMIAKLLLATCLLVSIDSSTAAPVTYAVSVDTSSISGTTGALDFNFNPGPFLTQSASAQVLGFASDGTLVGVPAIIGDEAGSLPAAVALDNSSVFNDYFQNFTFGSTLSFVISLDGPAISAPDGLSGSGSRFAFSMFSDLAGTLPALTLDATNGFAYVVDIGLDGSTTATNFIPGSAATVPEPSTGWLLVASLLALTALRLRREQVRDVIAWISGRGPRFALVG